MRKKPNLDKRLEKCAPVCLADPEKMRGKWKKSFGYDRICIEIGCGKGRFITETAKNDDKTLFIGIEREQGALVMAMEKAMEQEIKNVRFLDVDAERLCEIFEDGEIDGIYLNFSDPWPKKGYAKRRLTYADFLKTYRKILVPGGALIQKTDNENLFDFSLEQFEAEGLRVEYVTRDLHNSEYNEGNVMTEYEKNFSSQGMPIYSAKVIFE